MISYCKICGEELFHIKKNNVLICFHELNDNYFLNYWEENIKHKIPTLDLVHNNKLFEIKDFAKTKTKITEFNIEKYDHASQTFPKTINNFELNPIILDLDFSYFIKIAQTSQNNDYFVQKIKTILTIL